MYRIIGYEGNEDPAAPAPYTYGAAAVHDTKTHTLINAVAGRSTRYHGGPVKSVFMLPTPLYIQQYEGAFVARFRPERGTEALWHPLRYPALDHSRKDDLEYSAFQNLDALQTAATRVADNLLKFGGTVNETRLRLLLTLDYHHPRVNALWVHRSPNRSRIYNLALAQSGEAGKEEFLRCLAELDAQVQS